MKKIMDLKVGNLIELNGAVYCINDKKDIEQKLHSIEYSVLFLESPEEVYNQITPGKLYDIRRVEYDDDGDVNWLTVWPNEDGLDENYYDLYDDSFVVVSQIYDDRPDMIEFMIFNRQSEVDRLTKELKEIHSCQQRELVELTIEGLKAQIGLLEKRLERAKWQKPGAYARTTVAYEDSDIELPAGSLVKIIGYDYFTNESVQFKCLILDRADEIEHWRDIEDIKINSDHLEPVGSEDQEGIEEYRKSIAIKLSEKIYKRETSDDEDFKQLSKSELSQIEIDREYELITCIDIGRFPYDIEYTEADKEGMISFLNTLKQHAKSEVFRKNIEKAIEEVQGLHDPEDRIKSAEQIAEAWFQCGNINAYRMDTNGSFTVYQYRYTNGGGEEERVEYTTPCKYDMLSFLIKVYLLLNKMDFGSIKHKQELNEDIQKTIKILDQVEWTRWR